jgi:hypothetical protein
MPLEPGSFVLDDCDQVRSRLLRLLNDREFTRKDFAGWIGGSTVSLAAFLKQCGKHEGIKSRSYESAYHYLEHYYPIPVDNMRPRGNVVEARHFACTRERPVREGL